LKNEGGESTKRLFTSKIAEMRDVLLAVTKAVPKKLFQKALARKSCSKKFLRAKAVPKSACVLKLFQGTSRLHGKIVAVPKGLPLTRKGY